jgi:uncharacterized protein (DUF2225 family)
MNAALSTESNSHDDSDDDEDHTDIIVNEVLNLIAAAKDKKAVRQSVLETCMSKKSLYASLEMDVDDEENIDVDIAEEEGAVLRHMETSASILGSDENEQHLDECGLRRHLMIF